MKQDGKNKKIFTKIYETNHWKSRESVSGPGSELRQTVTIRGELPHVFEDLGIRTVLDIPCGDFNWMKHVDFSSISNYIGADIVAEIISVNNIKYGNQKIKFMELDITQDELPKSDLVFCRDCFVHLTFDEIFVAIDNIKKSKSKYLLVTTFNKEKVNTDTRNAKWRPLNFQIPPFDFCAPVKFIDTDFTDGDRQHPGNGMGLWQINHL